MWWSRRAGWPTRSRAMRARRERFTSATSMPVRGRSWRSRGTSPAPTARSRSTRRPGRGPTRSATQALTAGQPATDTLTVHSDDGTAYTVTVNLTGTNDAAVITETAGDDHVVVEAGGVANAIAGDASASGTLHVSDVDAGQGTFVAQPGNIAGTYGTFTFNAATGAWAYTLDNDRSATQDLTGGRPATDTRTVHSDDGTAYTVTVNLTGTNDAAVITETAGDDHVVVEAGGVANAIAGDASASGTLHVSDVDAGQGTFVAQPGNIAGTYGTFTFNAATGAWAYTLDNDRSATQALTAGQPATDTLTVQSDDGTAYTVTVNLTGTNDAAVITETAGDDH